jgi:hypothetical protein
MLEPIGYFVACKGSDDSFARVTIGTLTTIVYARAYFASIAAATADFP